MKIRIEDPVKHPGQIQEVRITRPASFPQSSTPPVAGAMEITEGLPLFIINGFGDCRDQLEDLIFRLNLQRFLVAEHDFASRYDSDGHTKFRTMSEMVESLAFEIISLNRPVIILAHSLGVKVAAKVCQMLNELGLSKLLGGLFAISPPPVHWWTPFPLRVMAKIASYPITLMTGRSVSLEPKHEAFIRDKVSGRSVRLGRVYGWVAWHLWLGSYPRLGTLNIPIEVIIGRKDGLVPLDLAIRIVRYNQTEATILDGTHYVHFDKGSSTILMKHLKEAVEVWSAKRKLISEFV